MENTNLTEYVPIGLMFLVATGFVAVIMTLTHVLGPRRKSKTKLDAFECGIESK